MMSMRATNPSGQACALERREPVSTKTTFHKALAFTMTLTLAGIASARRPPTLVEAQAGADAVAATCPEGQATPGYRDMFARNPSSSDDRSGFAATPPARKMGDHLVLVCEGGELHQGSGYRDFPARLQPAPTQPQIAIGSARTGS
jgi:hypothetical protein